jgi:hypothetical protein
MGRMRMSGRGGRVARVLIPGLFVGVVLQAGATAPKTVVAASPSSGTVSATMPSVAWDFAPVGGPPTTNPPNGATDSYQLTVQLPAADTAFYGPDVRQGSINAAVLEITITWNDSSADQALTLSVKDHNGNSVGDDTFGAVNDGSNINVFQLQDPLNETYTVTAQNGDEPTVVDPAIAAHAVATLQLIDLANQAQPPNPSGAPSFTPYHIPLSLMSPPRAEENALGGRLFGEPSIGVDPRNDDVMYQAGLFTIKATFNDSTTPATPTFSDVSDVPLETTLSLDAILDVDRGTGRTFVTQLDTLGACSAGAFSTDDGSSWTPAQSCQIPAGPDHQTIGAGAFAAPLPNPAPTYPDAVYYCSQSVAFAGCALSVDGGLTYGNQNQMWTSAQCFGLHGHVKVAPNDGTVYVPNKACGSPECLIVTSTAGPNCHPGFAVSTNNGLSWTVHTINDQHSRLYDTGDPSVGVGANGTMYFGNNDRDGHPKIAVCTNQGTTCGPSVDVSGPYHIENVEMPTVVAGDDNRAAFAFLGSTTPGDDQQNAFVGTWDLYVAVTYDGGAHWTTTDATPNAPVQRGCIEFDGDCPSSRGSDDQRNLLDFNDLTIDKEGRILYAYTDGCQQDPQPASGHGPCATDATRLSGLNPEIEGPAILRQNCGLTLYSQFDGTLPSCALSAGVPEVSRTGLLALGGSLAAFGVAAIARRRRRARAAA